MPKVVVLGFDAADPRLMDRWVAEGYLPHIERLRREGAGGPLRSTTPPLSPVAWSTAVTGMNPGNHGVFDWHERDPGTYHERIVNSTSIRAPTLWALANREGLSAGVLNVPLTYPPHPLDGWLVTDILTPPGAPIITYPESLRKEIDETCGGYRVFFGVTYREGDEQRFLDALHETLERRAQALLYLLKNHSTDLVMAVFMESDHVIHSFWKYHDATHPSHRPEYASYEHAIRDVYKHLDDVLGRVMSLLGSDGTLLVVSDHGCGPYHGHVHINKLLMQHQLLAIRKRPATRIKAWLARYRVAERLYGLSTYLGIDLRPLVPKRVRQAAVQSGIGARDIDWDRTSAYVSGDFGQVSVNLMGRERQGSVDPRDKEAVIDEVIRLLDTLRHPEDGKPLVDNVWRASALYAGKCLESAPDVIFCMRGYSYQNSMGLGLHVEGLVEKPRFAQGEVSGGHAPDGILYATGPGIRQGVQLEGMNLTQLAPTVLYRLGIAVPATMDGRVIESLFKPEHLASHPLRYRHGDAPEEEPAESDAIYSSEQLNQVESRLRDLGYLG